MILVVTVTGRGPTLPETNSKFAPVHGWLEYDPFLLGFSLFSGDMLVSGRVMHFKMQCIVLTSSPKVLRQKTSFENNI